MFLCARPFTIWHFTVCPFTVSFFTARCFTAWLFTGLIGIGAAHAVAVGEPLPAEVWERVRAHIPTNHPAGQRLVLFDAWASWCGPCRESFPFYEKTYRRWQGQGLVVIGLNMDSERESAAKFLHEVPVTFPIIYDQDKKIRGLLEIETLPRLYILDGSGTILQVVRGSTERSQRELGQFLEKFFNKKQQPKKNKENK